MTGVRPALFAIASLAFIVGCASAGAPSTDGPEGCYQIVWNRDMARLDMPWGFELHATPMPDPPGARPAFRATTRATATRRVELPFTYWQPTDEGLLRIGYPLGGSLTIDARYERGSLVGTARAVGDALAPGEAPGPRPPVAFRALRVVCPDPAGAWALGE